VCPWIGWGKIGAARKPAGFVIYEGRTITGLQSERRIS